MAALSSLLKRAANSVGVDVRRVASINDEALYRSLCSSESLEARRLYNVGAGRFRHRYWTNVDFESDWYRDAQGNAIGVSWDLLTEAPIPIEDGSAEIVYTSHTVEHITNGAAQNLFSEAHRILRPGGILQGTTPNIDLDYRAWRAGDRHHFYWANWYDTAEKAKEAMVTEPLATASLAQVFLHHFASSATTIHADGAPERIDDRQLEALFDTLDYEAALNACIAKCPLEIQRRHPGNHINWWTEEKMRRMFERAGFADIRRCGFGQSANPLLRDTTLFDNTHPKISLYLEATR